MNLVLKPRNRLFLVVMFVFSSNAKKETEHLFEQKKLITLMNSHTSHMVCLQNVEENYKPPEGLLKIKNVYMKTCKYGGIVVFINKLMCHSRLNLPKTLKTKRVIGVDFVYGTLLNVFYQKFDSYCDDLIKYIIAINETKPVIVCVSFEDDNEMKHDSEDEEDCECYKPKDSELAHVDALHGLAGDLHVTNAALCKSKLDEMCNMGFNLISNCTQSHIYCSLSLQKYINTTNKPDSRNQSDENINHIIDNITLNFQKKFIIKSKSKQALLDVDSSQDTDSQRSSKRKLDVGSAANKHSKIN